MLEKSIELDPDYALSYDELGQRINGLAQYGMRGSEEKKRAENYILKELSINNELLNALENFESIYTDTAWIEKLIDVTNKLIKINTNNISNHK